MWPVYTACLSYYYVFKNPYHLHYSDCAGCSYSEEYGDSFVSTWVVEVTVQSVCWSRTYSHLGASVTFTMSSTFSVAEYADMIYVTVIQFMP